MPPEARKESHIGALSPEHALLGLLAQSPAHGYELYQRLSTDLSQVWHISMSQAYNILNRLEAQGYIAGVVQEQDKLPARRLFHLTSLGQQRYGDWLNASSGSSVRSIRLELLTRLYFARLAGPQQAHRLVDMQIAETRQGLERLRALLAGIPGDQLINRLSLELRIRQLESILEWLQSCHLAIDSTPTQPSEEGEP
jgi:DNA-binding PadR family transcriptional regulator